MQGGSQPARGRSTRCDLYFGLLRDLKRVIDSIDGNAVEHYDDANVGYSQ